MLGPYRILAETDPASDACTANPHDGRFTGACCCETSQRPPRFAAVLTHAYGAPMRPVAAGYARALSAAATLLLLVASASLGAVSWSVVATQFRKHPAASVLAAAPLPPFSEVLARLPVAGARHASPGTTRDMTRPPPPRPGPATRPPPKPAPWLLPQRVEPAPVAPHTLFAHLEGPETHDPDMLWLRALHLATSGAEVTLMRTRLAHPGMDVVLGSSLRIVHEQGPGFVGVRVLDVGDGSSAAARAGVEAGDRIEAVNGFPLTTPRALEQASDAARGAHALVLEILRSGRRIGLRVDWRP